MINKIEDDLQGRNQNWDTLEAHLAENVNQGNPHGINSLVKKTMEDWKSATLINGWTGNFRYAKNDLGQVVIDARGLGTGTVSDKTKITTLPAGYRPVSPVVFAIWVGNIPPYDASIGFLIRVNGDVELLEPLASKLPANNPNSCLEGHVIFYAR